MCTHTHTLINTHTHNYAQLHRQTSELISNDKVYTQIGTCAHTHTHTHTHNYAQLHRQTSELISNDKVYTQTGTCAHTHTHTHTQFPLLNTQTFSTHIDIHVRTNIPHTQAHSQYVFYNNKGNHTTHSHIAYSTDG